MLGKANSQLRRSSGRMRGEGGGMLLGGRGARAGLFFVLTVISFHCVMAGQTTPTINTSTELVLVPTVVADKSGSHISGLTKDQFVVKQDGKAQSIAVFEEVKTDSSRVPRSSGERGTYSNIDPSGGDYHRLSIIVLDFVNTPAADQASARSALLKFLSNVADSGEPICLLELTFHGLVLLHDFTDDPRLLANALHQAQAISPAMIHEDTVDPHHPANGPMAGPLTEMIRGQLMSEAQLSSEVTKSAGSLTIKAMQQIAEAFRGLPGRKSLIWASSGFQFSLGAGSAQMYEKLWRMMNDAQIAIYSVDLRSSSLGVQLSTGGMRPSDIGDPQFDIDAQEREKKADVTNTLELFASNTGGKAFLGGSNLVQSFRQAVDDGSSYYMLGYYVSARSAKAGWHGISLTVHAKGAHVSYRNGFFLTRDTSSNAARQDIDLALSSPFDYTGIPVSASWQGSEKSKAAGKISMRFELVMPARFASVDEAEGNHMVVDLVAEARDEHGKLVGDTSHRVDVRLDAAGLEQIRQSGMTYRGTIQVPPGEYAVHFVVRDAIGNKMGSVIAPMKAGD